MDLRAFIATSISSAGLGDLLFFDSQWHIKVEIPGDGKYLLNLTGDFDGKLIRVFNDSSERCNVLNEGYQWEPYAEIQLGTQPAPAHLSGVVSEKGLAIACFTDDKKFFFSTTGSKESPATRGNLVFSQWSIRIRRLADAESWFLTSVGSKAKTT
ncbi:hypothetical protein XACLE20_530110 [Xanthomonas citri pv. citri]|uniref:hypothetical protein n=1 Tax=Xanthomonas citri TaxID=346 RepID=UPI00052BBD4F|nr:hypothetical protein [Xanthomonas citri]CEE85692.1 hypothetical protein XACLE20_530110 [Xanthomonas citri pv. citri]CEH39347.1 hypothetical protein XACLE3_2870007 [Xanthomonas citri pv. citri]